MAREQKSERRDMLNILEEVIEREFIPANQDVMEESGTSGRIGQMECHLSYDNRTEQTLLCKFDKAENNKVLFPYFREVHGFLGMCDYILFVEDVDNLFVFMIDLKDSANSAKHQATYAQTFAEFIINRIKTIKGEEAFPKPVSYRKIGVKTTCAKCTSKQYARLCYDEDNYLVLPNYHEFRTRLLMDL